MCVRVILHIRIRNFIKLCLEMWWGRQQDKGMKNTNFECVYTNMGTTVPALLCICVLLGPLSGYMCFIYTYIRIYTRLYMYTILLVSNLLRFILFGIFLLLLLPCVCANAEKKKKMWKKYTTIMFGFVNARKWVVFVDKNLSQQNWNWDRFIDPAYISGLSTQF